MNTLQRLQGEKAIREELKDQAILFMQPIAAASETILKKQDLVQVLKERLLDGGRYFDGRTVKIRTITPFRNFLFGSAGEEFYCMSHLEGLHNFWIRFYLIKNDVTLQVQVPGYD